MLWLKEKPTARPAGWKERIKHRRHMKRILAVILMGLVAPVMAQEIKPIDLDAPFADARVGLAWGENGERITTAHVPLVYKVGPNSGREYATLNFGIGKDSDDNKMGYVASIGLRVDTFFTKLSTSRRLERHFKFAVFPPLMVTPMFLTTDFKKFRPMVAVVTKFGGK
jgi:hypothetical protein